MLMRPAPPFPDHPLPLQQEEGFARALRALGSDAVIEGLHDCGQALVVTRCIGPLGRVRFTSRGPVFRHDAGVDDRIAALRGADLHVVNAAADDGAVLRGAGFWQIMTPATVAVLALNRDADVQLSHTAGKWRNAARQGMASGLRIRQGPFCPLRDNWLLTADKAQQGVKRFRALPHAVSLAYAQTNPFDAIMLTASEGATPVAAMLFLRHGTAATYQIGWSGVRGRTLRAHHALLLNAAQRLAELGATELDLGAIDTENTPGLTRFKLGSGATARRLGGTWIRLPAWRG